MNSKKEKGITGEYYARKYLESQGYSFITSNFRTRFGEIDLIFTHQNRIVFVEVKLRTSLTYGTPIESVTRRKLIKFKKALREFLATHQNYKNFVPTIEVFGIILEGDTPKITHIKDVS